MRILFICTHNRCRSIMAEAVCNHVGGGVFEAASAGSEPSGQVHPLAIETLHDAGIPVAGLHSKSWEDMESFEPDFVITVCDSAAREACPAWFGKSLRAHWSLTDPSRLEGSDKEVRAAFSNLLAILTQRIQKLRKLMDEKPDRTRILEFLRELGEE